jgi:hypothetical protein
MKRKGDKTWSEAERAIIRRHAGRLTCGEIGELIGRRSNAVRQEAGKMGVSLRRLGENHPKSVYTDAQIDQAVNLHFSGLTQREAAEQAGVNFHSLQKVLAGKLRRLAA